MSALIFDRTQADADRAAYLIGKIQSRETLTESEQAEYFAGLKGCYNATDLNRVEAAVKQLAAELNAAGYAVEVGETKHTTVPEGYQRLEYIESTGTQAINTGFIPNAKSRIMMDCEPTSYAATFCFYCSRSVASATVADSNTMFYISNAYRRDYYGASANTSGCYSSNERIIVDNNQGILKIGDKYTISNTTSSAVSPMPLVLLASAIASGSDVDTSSFGNFAPLKLYSAKIYDDSVLVRDFVTRKTPSGEVGLYDTITQSFYGNDGTGTFIAGPEIETESHDWQTTDIIRLSQWRQYLANVQALRDAYTALSTTPELPQPTDKLGIEGANNIERVLADIDTLISCMIASYRRCGAFNAGDNAAHLPLKGSAN